MMTDEGGASRPTFTCDKCKQPIRPEDGLLLWDLWDPWENPKIHESMLVCRRCDNPQHLFSQELGTGLIYLLICAGWLDDDLKPTAKLLTAAKKAMSLSCL